jgi:hypothetical protein
MGWLAQILPYNLGHHKLSTATSGKNSLSKILQAALSPMKDWGRCPKKMAWIEAIYSN